VSIEIAAWDDHPNALGHHRLFLALGRSLAKDEARYRLLFPELSESGSMPDSAARSPALSGNLAEVRMEQ
jgi:hypothetical protein